MGMIDTATLTELIELGEKATERPWKWTAGHGSPQLEGNIYDSDMNPVLVAEGCGNDSQTSSGVRGCMPEKLLDELRACPLHPSNRDRAYIAASANLAVPLAREVMRLREENERMRAKCADIESHHISNLADQVRVLKAEVERLRKKAGLAEEMRESMRLASLPVPQRKAIDMWGWRDRYDAIP